jgi:hypothetical protein
VAVGVSSFIPWGMKKITSRTHERVQDETGGLSLKIVNDL